LREELRFSQFTFLICIPMYNVEWGNFGQKLQSCPKLLYIHIQKHCNAYDKTNCLKGY